MRAFIPGAGIALFELATTPLTRVCASLLKAHFAVGLTRLPRCTRARAFAGADRIGTHVVATITRVGAFPSPRVASATGFSALHGRISGAGTAAGIHLGIFNGSVERWRQCRAFGLTPRAVDFARSHFVASFAGADSFGLAGSAQAHRTFALALPKPIHTPLTLYAATRTGNFTLFTRTTARGGGISDRVHGVWLASDQAKEDRPSPASPHHNFIVARRTHLFNLRASTLGRSATRC